MYQNIYYDRNNYEFHIWDDKYGYMKKKYIPYAYQKSYKGKYRSIYGDKLRKITGREIYQYDKEKLFEGDIEPRTRYLIDNYTDSIEPSEQNFCFFDIEVYSDDETFPVVEKANQPINAITFYLSKYKKYFTLLLDPDNQVGNIKTDNLIVYTFSTEKELLKKTVKFISNSDITILTGWNSWDFDNPYLFNRIKKLFNKHYLEKLSPINLMNYNNRKNYNEYTFAGFTLLDYLKIYKNFTYSEKSSYSLDNIANDELDKGKVSYDGSLNELWRNDRKKFLKYNIVDVKLMVELEEKRGYLDLVTRISHIGHVPYEYITSSLRIIDGAILTYMKQNNIIAPSVKRKKKEAFPGAYVKVPQKGRHEWVYDLDFSSLYPSIICTLNISPETKIGKINKWDDKSNNDTVKLYGEESKKEKMKEFLKENEYSISHDGVIYNMKQRGIIPNVIQNWLDTRSEFKKRRKEYAKQGNEEQEEKYDKAQHAYKILANSLYGVMANEFFRFYDTDNTKAITLTGQGAIKYAAKMANKYYKKEIENSNNKDYVLYGDTDSIMLSSKPLMKKIFPDKWENDPIKYSKNVCKVIQDYVNDKMEDYAKNVLNIKTYKYGHKFHLKHEWVADAGLFVAKKRYGLHILWEEGVDKDDMEIKGLDIVRSSYPEIFQDFLKDILKMIINDKDKEEIDKFIINFKEDIKDMNIKKIATPTGVKGMDKYYSEPPGHKKGTPVHVKAAINYNRWIDNNNLQSKFKKIQNNSKIKWIYVKKKLAGVNEMAWPNGDLPEKLENFIKDKINYKRIYKSSIDSKVKMFYEPLNWSKPIKKENTFKGFFE